ncbi:MAG: hypothetical protein ACR2K6_06580 [Solirubrobacterales bacterium]
MDLILAICQGLGLALAIGIGGGLVALFAAAMVSFDAGIDLDGTGYEFVGEPWFLAVLLGVVVVGVYLRGRSAAAPLLIGVAGVVGAIMFAASLAEEGEPTVPGLVAGAALAVGAAMIAASVLEGAQRRARSASEDEGAANTLVLLFAAAGLALAVIALFIPPLALAAAAALGWLARGRRRRSGEKYEGLRILR